MPVTVKEIFLYSLTLCNLRNAQYCRHLSMCLCIYVSMYQSTYLYSPQERQEGGPINSVDVNCVGVMRFAIEYFSFQFDRARPCYATASVGAHNADYLKPEAQKSE